jgi:hypothetical protein
VLLPGEVMKIVAMIAIAVVSEIGAWGADVTVYVHDPSVVPARELIRAQALANEIFASAGVKIDWRQYKPSPSLSRPEESIFVEMRTNTPKRRMPRSLAFAVPDAGGHITVFYDRIKEAAQFELTSTPLLAHVLVHEITHMLEGSEKHSDGGIMKATWSQKDIKAMRWRPLPFGEEDVESIRAGVAKRADAQMAISVYPAP